MEFGTLYHKGSSGALYSWRVWTEGSEIVTEYGQVDGKKQLTRKTAEPKNVGKANATTAEQQAEAEAQSMWTHRIERKYRASVQEAEEDEVFLPMLASEFEKRRGQKKDGHTYACDFQPKLDGLRALAFWEGDEVKLLSRGGKFYTCPHITEKLQEVLPPNMVLDGELYLHGTTFQTLTSWVKRLQDDTYKIQYHVYDCVLLDDRQAQWDARYTALYLFFDKYRDSFESKIELLPTFECNSEEDIQNLYGKVVAKGYEGGIVRMRDNSAYRFGHRSNRLLKVKSFQDSEYLVVGYGQGRGRFADCAIFTCQVKEGVTFEVLVRGTLEQRREMLTNGPSYVGQWLKVKYFDFTDEGKPRFPVGLGFRLPEDMSS